MHVQTADALRLIALYALGHLSVTAMLVAGTRSVDTDLHGAIVAIGLLALLLLCWAAQHSVLRSAMNDPVSSSQWFFALLFGAVIVTATAVLVAMVTLVVTMAQSQLADPVSQIAQSVGEALGTVVGTPALNPDAAIPLAVLSLIAFIAALLLHWPAASLLKRRLKRGTRSYLWAAGISTLLPLAGMKAYFDYAGPLVESLPAQAAPLAGVVLAPIVGAVAAIIVLIGLRLLSERPKEAPAQ